MQAKIIKLARPHAYTRIEDARSIRRVATLKVIQLVFSAVTVFFSHNNSVRILFFNQFIQVSASRTGPSLISFFQLGIILHVYISMHLHALQWLSAAAIVVISHPRLVVITVDLMLRLSSPTPSATTR